MPSSVSASAVRRIPLRASASRRSASACFKNLQVLQPRQGASTSTSKSAVQVRQWCITGAVNPRITSSIVGGNKPQVGWRALACGSFGKLRSRCHQIRQHRADYINKCIKVRKFQVFPLITCGIESAMRRHPPGASTGCRRSASASNTQ